jgi:hypothetical protein
MSKVVKSDKMGASGTRWILRTLASVIALLLCTASTVVGQKVNLAWNRNAETNLTSYVLKYGAVSGSYTGQVTVSSSLTAATVSNLPPNRTYYFVVTARNTASMESDPSTEVNYYVPRVGTNTPPVANAQSVSTPEDTAKTITLTGSDADGDPLTYSVVANPANGTLSGTAPSLTYTPTANFSGADSFTFRVNDGLSNSTLATVSITVTAVNDRPTLNALSNLTVPTNAGPQTVALGGITAGAAGENQTLTVTATSSNPSLIPNPTVSYTSPNTAGSLSFTPANGGSGTATITVTVNDGQAQNNTFSRTFTVGVGAPPTVTLFLEAESATLVSPMVSGSDANASNGQYIYSTTDSAGAATWTLNIPQAGDYVVWCRVLAADAGTDSFFATVDGGAQDIYDTVLSNAWSSAWQWAQFAGRTAGRPWVMTFSAGTHTLSMQGREAMAMLDALYVTTDRNFVPGASTTNTPPTLNAINNLSINEDAGQQTVSLANITSGSASESQTLTVTASSSNTGLIPNPAVNYTSPNSTGTLTFTPVANANGSATITVTVNDGQAQNNTVTRTFTVTVAAVNDPPTLNALANLSIAEDSGLQTVSLAGIGSGAANESQTLTVTASSSNTGLIPNPAVNYTSPNATGTLTFTPVANASGSATITVTVNDGQAANNTVSRTFNVTVSSINDPPTLNAIGNVTLNEDAGLQTVNLAGISSGSEVQTLVVTASSSNTGLIPTPTVNYTSPNATGTLTFTPVANANGPATITVTVNDGGAINNTVTRTFTVTVTAVNDAPTLDPVANVTVNEDAGAQTVNLTGIGSGAANESQTLTVTASSSNTGLVPNPTVAYTSPNATGTLTFTPVANANGSATITVTVNDGQAANNTVSRTFTVTVAAVNDPPTLNAIANLSIAEDSGLQTVSLAGIGSGAANESQTLTVTASSSNTGLIPNPTVNYTSPNATGTLTFTPVANAAGTATITVTVNDGQAQNNTVSRTFNVAVSVVNNPPTLTPISNVTINEDAGFQTVNLTGISSGGENQTLVVTASSSNPGLIPNPTVNYTSPNATGTLTFTPVADANGSANVTVTVNDGGPVSNTVTRIFAVTVTAVNDPPTLDPIASITLNEDAGAQTINLTGIGTGAANESQTLTVTASSSNTGLVPNPTVNYTSPNASGTLTFTPAANANGTATITVTVNDGASANNTIARTFTVTVNAVNDAPTLNPISNLTINEDAGLQTVSLAGISAGAGESQPLIVTAISSDNSLIPNPTVIYTSPNATGSLTFTPVPNASGLATITVTVNDGATANNTITRTFTVTVNPVNDPPTLNPIANLTIAEDSPQQTVALSGIGSGAPDEDQVLTITAASSNPSLIPTPTVSYVNGDTTGSLSFKPATNANGTATITVTVNDGQAANNTVSRSFTVTVSGVNDAPTITALADQVVNENTTTGPLAFTIGDTETAASSLTLSATSSNPGLIPAANIVFGGSGANRTVSVTPQSRQNGSAAITVQVADANGGTASRTFNVAVTPVNDAPTLNSLVNVTVNEDAGTQLVNLAGISSGATNEVQPLTVTATSSNPGLIPDLAVNYTSPSSTGTLSFTPAPNANGTAMITVTVDDGQAQNNTVSRSFTLTVTAVNDPPTLNPLNDLTLNEDSGNQTVVLSGITSGALNESQTLTVTATSSLTSVIPNPTVNYTSPNSAGTLILKTTTNATGVATITVTVNDGQSANNTITRTFNVTVLGVNDPPTISTIADVSISEGTATAALPFTVSDVETPAANLVVSGSSANPTLVPDANIVFGGSGASRTVTVTPAASLFGSALITVQVADGNGGQATKSFTVTVTSINQPPTINAINNVTINEDAGPQSVPLTGISAGAANENQPLTITASSSNPTLLPNLAVNYTSPNTTGALTFAPAANLNGNATVTVTVNDGQSQNNTTTRTFLVTVNAQNDPPTISQIADQTTPQNTATGLIPFTIGDVETSASSLTVGASSSNPSLISALTLGGSGANRTLRITPAQNQFGTAVITVTVADGDGGIGSDSFLLTVTTVNQPPTLDALSDVTIVEDAGPQTVTLTGISSGSASENQTLTVTAISSDPSLIPYPVITYTSPNATGQLVFTPVTNGNGMATITVTVSDGQSQNATATRSFDVVINSVNDGPTLNPIANVTLAANTPLHTVALGGISPGAVNEDQVVTITAVSSNPGLIPDPVVSYFSPNTTGSLTVSPTPGASGSATITVTADDGQSENNSIVRVFSVSVSGANRPPTITDLPDISLPVGGIASPLNILVGDAETPADSLRVVASSSNPGLVWANNIIISGTGSNRVASVVTTPGVSGVAVITFTVSDTDGGSASDSFVLTAVPANVPPTLDPISSLTVTEDSGPRTIPLTGITAGGPGENQTLIVTAVSSTPSVIPHPTISYTSPNTTGTLTFTPAANTSGSATIIVTVNDGQNRDNLITRTFGVLVTAGNDAPTVSPIANQIVAVSTPTPVLPFIIGDLETPTDALGVSTASSNPTLVPSGNIVLGGSGANRTVQVTPAANQSGTATISIFVSDGALIAASSFDVTVGSPNTAPTIIAPSSLATDSYTPLTNVNVVVVDKESRPQDLVINATSYNQSVLPNTNIIITGTSSNRVMTLRPIPGKSGTVAISLSVSDGSAIGRSTCQLTVQLGTTPKAKLNVRRKGNGTVQPALDGMDLTIGSTYTLTAIPGANDIFVGWGGSLTSATRSVTFVMTTNFELVCGFTNNPYPALQGTYNGLFYEVDEVRPGSSGSFTVTPTDKGTFSGKLKLAGASYSFSGKVDISCRATNIVARKGASALTVEIDFSHTTNQVVGRVTDGFWEAPLLGDRAVYNSKSNPAPFAGSYTFMVPGQDDPAAGPEGHSGASLKIDGSGRATLAGTLADGTKISLKVPISANRHWPVYLPLYGGLGSVLSWQTLANRPTDDLNGLLSWIKPAMPKAKTYAGGFTNDVIAVGSRFVAPQPPAAKLLNLTDGFASFTGGDLTTDFTDVFHYDDNGKITSAGVHKLSVSLNKSSGLMTGSVTDPGTGKAVKFSGVVFQKRNMAAGFQLGTSRSARVDLTDE